MILEKNKKDIIGNDDILDMSEMTILDENDKVKLKFIFNGVNGGNGNNVGYRMVVDVDYYVFIHIK